MNNRYKFWIFSLIIYALSFSHLQAKDIQEKIKKRIEDISHDLQKGVDQVGEDIEAAQAYLDQYPWKGVIEEQVTSSPITLSHFRLNGHPKAVVAHPGEKIDAEVKCFLDSEKASKLSFYRVVMGIKGVGPQTTVCNQLGVVSGHKTEKFIIQAPQQPGVYEVRFRVVENFTESEALKNWLDSRGGEPDETTTLGVIIVK